MVSDWVVACLPPKISRCKDRVTARKDGHQHAWGLGQEAGGPSAAPMSPQPDGSVPSRVGEVQKLERHAHSMEESVEVTVPRTNNQHAWGLRQHKLKA
jgi:hypothetical protein